MIDPKSNKKSKVGVKSNKQLKVDEKSMKEPKGDREPSKEPKVMEPKVDFRVQFTTNRKFNSQDKMLACVHVEAEKL
jgi:hypothetical protein